MNEMQVFENKVFGQLRTVEQNGQTWFVAADVCRALELGQVTNAIRRLDDDEKALISIKGISRGNDQVSIVNEPGLYTLVLGSRKPEAKAFKRWLTHEVLPAIRKHRLYLMDELVHNSDELSKALKQYIEDYNMQSLPTTARYGNETQQRVSNFMNLFTGGKEVPKLPTAYDLMPQTFADDLDQPYMQQAKSVYEATGKASALPHPNQSFTVGGTEYSVDEADWDNFTLQYKMAYQKYLVGNSKGWELLTDEERLEVLSRAHTAGSNAAKKWYTKLKKIK